MVRSHARNNTTQANLTYYERSLLKKDGAAKRLGADSFRPIDSCNLCLSRVSDPVSCQQGHLYCRECVLSDLITQKAGIESQKRELERWEANELREKEEARQRARERVVSDFEKGMGLAGSSGKQVIEENKDGKAGDRFRFDQDARERVAKEAEEKAMKRIEMEQAEARKAKLPAYWLPALAPEGRATPLKDVKLQTLCHLGESPHPLSRKTLLPVIFTYPSEGSKPNCPSCTKELSNATPTFLLSSRSSAASASNGDAQPATKKKKMKKDKEESYTCGHVVCKTCADTIVKPSQSCPICDATVKAEGIIPLGKEGTGFAAAGGAEVKKATVSFRV